jgi:hypothetical protein
MRLRRTSGLPRRWRAPPPSATTRLGEAAPQLLAGDRLGGAARALAGPHRPPAARHAVQHREVGERHSGEIDAGWGHGHLRWR